MLAPTCFPRSIQIVFGLALGALWLTSSTGCDGTVLLGNPGPADDGGVVILDGSFVRPDASTPNDGGVDGGLDAGADDGGVVDSGPATDGGFVLPDGGGLSEYTGDAELGVRCGNPLQTCAAGAPCCVALEGFNLTAQCGTETAPGDPSSCPAYSISCDDRQEDCSDDDVCCFVLEVAFPIVLNATCMSAQACAAIAADPEQPDSAETCVATSDCADGQLCCGVDVPGIGIPLDIGVCQPTCEVALP